MSMIVLMEQSEREELLDKVEEIVHKELVPVLDILMEYLDVRFDEVEERFLLAFGGINELLDRLAEALNSRDPAE